MDENAFGLLISYLDIEDDEYSDEACATEGSCSFVQRFETFCETLNHFVEEKVAELPGLEETEKLNILELGHNIYLEGSEELWGKKAFAWLKAIKLLLSEQGYSVAVHLSYGGRWLNEAEPQKRSSLSPYLRRWMVSLPSEPLRKCLLADSASRGDEERDGWGSGCFADVEAMEALGLTPKNQPTELKLPGAIFWRVGS